jgi:hypothetical protein
MGVGGLLLALVATAISLLGGMAVLLSDRGALPPLESENFPSHSS